MLPYIIRGNGTNTIVTFVTSDYETITVPLKHPNQRKITDTLVSQTLQDDDVVTTDRLKSLLKGDLWKWTDLTTSRHPWLDDRELPIQSPESFRFIDNPISHTLRNKDYTFIIGATGSGKTIMTLEPKVLADLLKKGRNFKVTAEHEQEAKHQKSEDTGSEPHSAPIGRVIPTKIPVSEANFTGYTGSSGRFSVGGF